MSDSPDARGLHRPPPRVRWTGRSVGGRTADAELSRRAAALQLRRGASIALRLCLYLLPFAVVVTVLISKLYP